MRFRVTQKDIAQGQPGSGTSCPVARSITRRLGSSSKWIVRVGSIAIYVGPKDVGPEDGSMIAPLKVADFITVFDALGPGHVVPFSFSLPIPEPRRKA